MDFKINDIITINGGIEYEIVDILEYNLNKYFYLSKIDDDEFAIVKLVNFNNNQMLSDLSNEEYKEVLNLLTQKQLEN